VEELAEINKQLTEALQHDPDEETGDSGKRAIASFEAKDMAKRVEQLEQTTQRQLEVISAQEETIDEMAKELVGNACVVFSLLLLFVKKLEKKRLPKETKWTICRKNLYRRGASSRRWKRRFPSWSWPSKRPSPSTER